MAAMMGMATHSWASEKEDISVAVSQPGASRWPPEAQFSTISCGSCFRRALEGIQSPRALSQALSSGLYHPASMTK